MQGNFDPSKDRDYFRVPVGETSRPDDWWDSGERGWITMGKDELVVNGIELYRKKAILPYDQAKDETIRLLKTELTASKIQIATYKIMIRRIREYLDSRNIANDVRLHNIGKILNGKY